MKQNTLFGIGPLGKSLVGGTGASVFAQFEGVISLILGVITVSAGLWFVFQIFGGALQWLASGGEKQALQNAQKRLTNAVVGLAIVVFSYVLIALISSLFGLYILSPFAALKGAPPPGYTPTEPTEPTEPDPCFNPKPGGKPIPC